MARSHHLVRIGKLEGRIVQLRGQRVMLSFDLAKLYGVPTKALGQAVKRNIDRFPDDFLFVLSKGEWEDLKSQFVTSSWGGMRRGTAYAFTQEGVAMLSSVLRSPRAVRVNVEIMRTFVRLRRMLLISASLRHKLAELEKRVHLHDEQFAAVIQAIRELMEPPPQPRKKPIGYSTERDDQPSRELRRRRG